MGDLEGIRSDLANAEFVVMAAMAELDLLAHLIIDLGPTSGGSGLERAELDRLLLPIGGDRSGRQRHGCGLTVERRATGQSIHPTDVDSVRAEILVAE